MSEPVALSVSVPLSHMEGINPERAAMLEAAARDEVENPVVLKVEEESSPIITGANLAPVGNPINRPVRRSVSREEGELPPPNLALPLKLSPPAQGFPPGVLAFRGNPSQKRPGGATAGSGRKKKKKKQKTEASEQASGGLLIPPLDPPPPPDANSNYLLSLLQLRPFRLTLLPYGKDDKRCRSKELRLAASVVGLLQQQTISKWKGIPTLKVEATSADIHKPEYALVQSIDGVLLEDIWSSLSSQDKMGFCRQLRKIVSNMRKACMPGPVGSASSGPYSLLLDKHPRHSYYAIRGHGDSTQFLAFLASSFFESVPTTVMDALVMGFSTETPLSLTHGELCPRNIIVRNNAVVAIIGWDSAGWYPRWWEYVKFFEAKTREGNADWYEYATTIFVEQSPKELALYQGMVRCQRG